MNLKHAILSLTLFVFIWGSCSPDSLEDNALVAKRFELMNNDSLGIHFSNDLPYTEEFNTYTYRNFYNGGGVSLGDINNDGWIDIFITGNIVDNKLYLNKGDLKFEDITDQAGVACKDVWCTGSIFADINGDGLEDLYVCKAGKPGGANRSNDLFINNGDLTFTESAEQYGLDVEGLSIHSAFFDYDKDGDLDCYLLNNSLRSVGGFDLDEGLRDIPDPEGNKFLINDNGRFVDATAEAGLYLSNIGYGLGITLADFNNDTWPDVFISNDFFEKDYLYLNNQNGGFVEVSNRAFSSLSMGSMGADACDLDNDMLPDLFVTEMLPEAWDRRKTKAQYDTWDKYQASIKNGYHHQFSRNVLQKNLGNGEFVEIGRLAGVASTDWSWSALMQDFDNDGKRDIFVTNGIYKDLLDKDYINYFANRNMIKAKIDQDQEVITLLIDSMPSEPIMNKMYRNTGTLHFEDIGSGWGLNAKTFSNGATYSDLDNDGDLDLVINNVNQPLMIYRNTTDTSQNFIQFDLRELSKNPKAIGAKVIITSGEWHSMYENYNSKGFQSSVSKTVHFGLGDRKSVDQVKVVWPDGESRVYQNLPINQRHTLTKEKGDRIRTKLPDMEELPKQYTTTLTHSGSSLNYFSRERLMMDMNDHTGPHHASAEIFGDGVEYLFADLGFKQGGKLYEVKAGGMRPTDWLDISNGQEITDLVWTDVDGDLDLDLYIAFGGGHISRFSGSLDDELWINNGKNKPFTNAQITFDRKIPTSSVAVIDWNKDGKQDFVISEKYTDNKYGAAGRLYLLENYGNGRLSEPQALGNIRGMLTDLAVIDWDQNGFPDVIAVGKWMPISIVLNNDGSSQNAQNKVMPNSSGLWNVIEVMDVDEDGDADLILGNEGENNFYENDMRLFVYDFDDNGSIDQIICSQEEGKFYPVHDIDEMFSQMPGLKKKFQFYEKFSRADMEDLFGVEKLQAAKAYDLNERRSIILVNMVEDFVKVVLPESIQFSSVHAAYADTSISKRTLLLGGNYYRTKPQFGRQDASSGWLLRTSGRDSSLTFEKPRVLGINGEIRSITPVDNNILFGINDSGSIKVKKSELYE